MTEPPNAVFVADVSRALAQGASATVEGNRLVLRYEGGSIGSIGCGTQEAAQALLDAASAAG